MQGFNKLAGVQDPPPSSFPEPPPIPQSDHDIESQTSHSLNSRPSRASLPVDRKPSRRTLNGQSSQPSLRPHSLDPGEPNYAASQRSRESTFAESQDGIPWGPQHPCFPHPNPHVPVESHDYAATRIVRVQRDWLVAGDLYPALQNLYPEILVGFITEDQFRSLIATLNKMLEEAFTPWSVGGWFDAILGIATGFLWDNTGLTASKRKVAQMERWVDDWNHEAESQGRQVKLIGLRRTGFLSLDIQIPDPHIDDPVPSDTASRP